MRNIYTLTAALIISFAANAQEKKKTILSRAEKANDHFMVQVGANMWSGKPDSIKTKNLGRDINIYFMFDFPFKTNPKLSVGLGAGVGSASVFFDRGSVDITGNSARLVFRNLDSANHFKKYKLATAYLEAPVELRYVQNPDNSDRSFKFAIGAKVGTLVDVHTRAKELRDKNGTAINNYTEKIKQKKYFNSTRLSVTGRIGWGNFSVYGQYQVTTLLKDGAGAAIRPITVGLTLSGL
jgi:Outer membrane protein beta-barrel domain